MSAKPNLNLYAGLGGNRKLWAGCKVVAVESNKDIAAAYSEQYPEDEMIIGDAHQFLLDNYKDFGFAWSSPPCQSHSKMILSGRNRTPRYPDMRLYEEILFLKHFFKGKWVVENVMPYYTPLIAAKKIGRHLFWSNFTISDMIVVPEFKNMMNRQNLEAKKQLQQWLGIKITKTIYYDGNHCPTQVLRNCVHPLIGEHVYNCSTFNNKLF